MKQVEIYVKGLCKRFLNEKYIGGYGIYLKYRNFSKRIIKIKNNSNNIEMDLKSIVVSLRNLKEPCNVIIYSDSEYIVKNINEGRISVWKKNNWQTVNNWNRSKKPLANKELWIELSKLIEIHNVKFICIKKTNKINKEIKTFINKAINSFNETGKVENFYTLDI